MKRFLLFASLVLAWCLHAQPTAVTLTFKTIADMQAHVITAFQTNVVANVSDTNRGGLFLSTPDALTVDNGIVFTNTAQARVWKRLHDGPANVLWWGCVGDNSTDNAIALQAAITWANQPSENTLTNGFNRALFIPAGDYVMSTGVTSQYGINIVGEGSSRTLLRHTGTGNLITLDNRVFGNGRYVIEGIGMLQTVTGSTGAGLFITGDDVANKSFQASFRDLMIGQIGETHHWRDGIYYDCSIAGLQGGVFENIVIWSPSRYGIYADGLMNNTAFIACYTRNTGADGFYFRAGNYLNFSACAADGPIGDGYDFFIPGTASFTGCGSEITGGAGVPFRIGEGSYSFDSVFGTCLRDADDAAGVVVTDTFGATFTSSRIIGPGTGKGIGLVVTDSGGSPSEVMISHPTFQGWATNVANPYSFFDVTSGFGGQYPYMFLGSPGATASQSNYVFRVGPTLPRSATSSSATMGTMYLGGNFTGTTPASSTANGLTIQNTLGLDSGQTVTYNYGLNIGASSKGTGVTVTYGAGAYIADQTLAGRNASLLIGTTVPTVTGVTATNSWSMINASQYPTYIGNQLFLKDVVGNPKKVFAAGPSQTTSRDSLDDSTLIVDPTSNLGGFTNSWLPYSGVATNVSLIITGTGGATNNVAISGLSGPTRYVTTVLTTSGTPAITGDATITVYVGGNLHKTFAAGSAPGATETFSGMVGGTSTAVWILASAGTGTLDVIFETIQITVLAAGDLLHRHTYTANTLTANAGAAPYFEFTASGSFANNESKSILLAIAGTPVTSTPMMLQTITVTNSGPWRLNGQVFATGNSSYALNSVFVSDPIWIGGTNYGAGFVTNFNVVPTSFTGTSNYWANGANIYFGADADGADSDVTINTSTIEYKP